MTNDFRMSYFMPPIAPIKNEQGRIVTPATLIPSCEVSIEQVFQMITCNENLKILTEQVRNSGDIRTAKSITIAIRDSLWYVLASKQQMFRSFFTSGGGRYRPSRLLSGGSGNAQRIV